MDLTSNTQRPTAPRQARQQLAAFVPKLHGIIESNSLSEHHATTIARSPSAIKRLM